MSNRRTANPVPGTGDASKDIGGAVVRRRFSYGGTELTNGMVLSAGELTSMPRNNLNALRDNGYIHIFPKAVRTHLEADLLTVKVERHIISRGFGKFDVIEGRVLNAYPLTKERAEDLKAQLKENEPPTTVRPGKPIQNADGTLLDGPVPDPTVSASSVTTTSA